LQIDRGGERAELSKKTRRAPLYRQLQQQILPRPLQALGGRTGGVGDCLRRQGRSPQPLVACGRGGMVISLGATDEPIELSAFDLLFQATWRRWRASTGTSKGWRCDAAILAR